MVAPCGAPRERLQTCAYMNASSEYNVLMLMFLCVYTMRVSRPFLLGPRLGLLVGADDAGTVSLGACDAALLESE